MVLKDILLSLVVLVLVSTAAVADRAPKPGTFYKDSELGIRKKELKGSKLHITFSPKHEQFYWCPGIKVNHSSKATVVTFVRSKTSGNGKVDQKAKYDKKMITQKVVIDTKKRDTYIRNGEKLFKKIYSPKEKDSSTQTKNASVNKKAGSKSKSGANTPSVLPNLRQAGAKPVGELRPSSSSVKKRKMLLNDFALPSSD